MEMNHWLDETTAADIMVRNVVTFDPNDCLAVAAETLLTEQISGAPVVDQADHCVGVFSIVDVLGAEEKVLEESESIAGSSYFNSDLALPASVYADRLAQVRDKLIPASEQPIRHFMTRDVVSVTPESTMRTIVTDLVDAHIHRLVVLDDQRTLLGIISSSDVLAAILRAAS